MNEKLYVARLSRCTTDELMSLQKHLKETGNRRFAKMMMQLVTTVLFARVGLSPA